MDMDVLELETVTTVPIQPTSHWVFEEMLAAPAPVRATKAVRTGDPIWAQVLVLLGAFFSVGAGSFIITTHLL